MVLQGKAEMSQAGVIGQNPADGTASSQRGRCKLAGVCVRGGRRLAKMS